MNIAFVLFCISGGYLLLHLLIHGIRMRRAHLVDDLDVHPFFERSEETLGEVVDTTKVFLRKLNRSTVAQAVGRFLILSARTALRFVRWSIQHLEYIERRLRRHMYRVGGAPSFFLKDMSTHKQSTQRYRGEIHDTP
jgi:hypothetical protein